MLTTSMTTMAAKSLRIRYASTLVGAGGRPPPGEVPATLTYTFL